jgi:2-methylfumaryl-CoA isomerase
VFSALEQALDADLELEGDRYRLRETIAAVLRPWFAQRDFATIEGLLNRAHVLWSPYLDMLEVVAASRRDPRSIAAEVDELDAGRIIATGSPLRWDGEFARPVRSPRLGEHTDQVLSEVLGLTSAEVGRLHDRALLGVAQ